jgi:hypothetical protein
MKEQKLKLDIDNKLLGGLVKALFQRLNLSLLASNMHSKKIVKDLNELCTVK